MCQIQLRMFHQIWTTSTLWPNWLWLQWATKVVETPLGNDALQCLSICSISFSSSGNSLIPRHPNSVLCRRCGLCSPRNRKINIVLGWRGKNVPRHSKTEFYYQVSQHFVMHCSWGLRQSMQYYTNLVEYCYLYTNANCAIWLAELLCFDIFYNIFW